MRAVVLAAGEGRRMRPLTAYRSKVMLPVADRPILEHLVERLREAGCTELCFVVNYRAEAIERHFGDGSDLGVSIGYVRQDAPRGTGDAALKAEGFVGDEDFLLVNGDVLVEAADVERVLAADASGGGGGAATGQAAGGGGGTGADGGGEAMLVAPVDDVASYGAVAVEDGRVAGLQEKPPEGGPGLANAGLYRLTPGIFPVLADLEASPRGEIELTDAIRRRIEGDGTGGAGGPGVEGGGGVLAVEAKTWLDVARPWDLLAANELLLSDLETSIEGDVEEGVRMEGPVVVREGARVRSGAYLEGPVLIGPGADVGPNCYVRGTTVIGAGARVGNGCEVKNSLIMEDAHAAHLSYVGDSVLGREVNLGAGTVTANLRLDERTVPVVTEEGRVDSGRRKLGAVLGDRVKTGINASLDVGTVVGEDSFIGPGALVRGTHGPRSRIH